MIVVTGILDREWRYARTAEEIRDLVRAILDEEPRERSQLYVWNRPL
ncbi:hypothetical protein AB0H34_39600 [Saccharopolyspora shandongensis]